MINVTDSKGFFRVTSGQIENRKTGEIRSVSGIRLHELQWDDENTMIKKCCQAFESGKWPNS